MRTQKAEISSGIQKKEYLISLFFWKENLVLNELTLRKDLAKHTYKSNPIKEFKIKFLYTYEETHFRTTPLLRFNLGERNHRVRKLWMVLL